MKFCNLTKWIFLNVKFFTFFMYKISMYYTLIYFNVTIDSVIICNLISFYNDVISSSIYLNHYDLHLNIFFSHLLRLTKITS